MENSRTKILDILRRRREATVDDLTHALELAPATVRRHLDILQRDGYVSVRPVRRDTGRPHYAFSLTEAGESLFPQNYVRITNRLIDVIVSLRPEDTDGKSGEELAGVIFERMAERLARTHAPAVTAGTLSGRLEQTLDALSTEGIVFDLRQEGDGWLLLGRGCPCRRIADKHPQACSHDQRLLARLLEAEVVALEPARAGGDAQCAYLVREAKRPVASVPHVRV